MTIIQNLNSQSHRFIGKVLYKKMNKTGAMEISRFWYHHKYKVKVKTTKKIFFHDENNVTDPGDVIEILHAGRKLSKTKAFVLSKIVEKNPVIVAMEKDNIAEARVAMDKLRDMERGLLGEINLRRVKNHPAHEKRNALIRGKTVPDLEAIAAG